MKAILKHNYNWPEDIQRLLAWNQRRNFRKRSSFQSVKDTVLVAVLCILLHPLEVLLVTLDAPGVVCELRDSVTVTVLQSVVEHFSLLQPVQLHVVL